MRWPIVVLIWRCFNALTPFHLKWECMNNFTKSTWKIIRTLLLIQVVLEWWLRIWFRYCLSKWPHNIQWEPSKTVHFLSIYFNKLKNNCRNHFTIGEKVLLSHYQSGDWAIVKHSIWTNAFLFVGNSLLAHVSMRWHSRVYVAHYRNLSSHMELCRVETHSGPCLSGAQLTNKNFTRPY